MEALTTYHTARLVSVRRMSNVKRIGALATGFTGIAVIALPAIWTNSNTGESLANAQGIIYLLAAALNCATGSNLARRLQADLVPARLISRAQLAAAIWTLPIARQELQISHLRGAPSPPLRSLAS